LGCLLQVLSPIGTPAAHAALGDGPDWLPFKNSAPGVRINCTWNNGCKNGYHGYPAIDFNTGYGFPIYAAGNGTLTAYTGCNATTYSTCGPDNFGNAVRINHPNGLTSWYAHLSSVSRGSGPVSAGELIGYSGNSGHSYGAHLHYEVRPANGGWGSQIAPPPLHATQGATVVSYPRALGYNAWGGSGGVPCGIQGDEPNCTSDHRVWSNGITSSSAGLSGNVVPNGGFESGAWSTLVSGTNMVAYDNGTAYSGRKYLATNTPSSGGSVYKDIALNAQPGQVYCGSAVVRSQAGSTGASGTFVVWLLGGSYNEKGQRAFRGLSNSWSRVNTCVSATTPHSLMRVQFYPTPGSGKTVDIDDVDVHASMVPNGGFESGAWSTLVSGTNMVAYDNGTAYSGRKYLATNTPSSGGSVYKDIALNAQPGQVYCGSAVVRSQAGSTGASGTFVVWLLGGSYNEKGQRAFRGLSNSWSRVNTCVSATTPHSLMRVQFYPTPGSGKTVDIDDVDIR